MARHDLLLYPTPGVTVQSAFIIPTYAPKCAGRWDEIRDWAAYQFECDADDVDLVEVYWGGEYEDDENREALTVRGKIVGVFDDPLDDIGWRDMLDAYAGKRALITTPSVPLAAE